MTTRSIGMRLVYALALPILIIAVWWAATLNETNPFVPKPGQIVSDFFGSWFGPLILQQVLPSLYRLGVGLSEDRAHQRGDHRLGALGHTGQQVAHEMGATALPHRPGQRGAHGVDQTRVGVGGHQGDPAQPAGDEAPQERHPTSTVFCGDDVEAEPLQGRGNRLRVADRLLQLRHVTIGVVADHEPDALGVRDAVRRAADEDRCEGEEIRPQGDIPSIGRSEG